MEPPAEYPNLLSTDDLDDLFNALNILRHVDDETLESPRIKGITQKYRKGTPGHKRTEKLYEKLQTISKIRAFISQPL